MTDRELQSLALVHHEILLLICRNHPEISKAFDASSNGEKPPVWESLFEIISTKKGVSDDARMVAKDAIKLAKALRDVKKPFEGEHARRVANLGAALIRLGSPKKQLNFLKKVKQRKSLKSEFPDKLDFSISILETGLNTVYNYRKLKLEIDTASKKNNAKGFSVNPNDISAADALGASIYAEPSDLTIAFWPMPIFGITGLAYASLVGASVTSSYELASKFVDVIHGPNDPNGPIWWPTPGPADPLPPMT